MEKILVGTIATSGTIMASPLTVITVVSNLTNAAADTPTPDEFLIDVLKKVTLIVIVARGTFSLLDYARQYVYPTAEQELEQRKRKKFTVNPLLNS
jgi:hypothetical protein